MKRRKQRFARIAVPETGISPQQAYQLRLIPGVDELLSRPRIADLAARMDREILLGVLREVLSELRTQIIAPEIARTTVFDASSIDELVDAEANRILQPSLQPVINATGVILHTNLGRAPLSPSVIDAMQKVAAQYSNLEYDLGSGGRGKRDVHTGDLLTRLTGAQAAIVVNNCAAAVLLVLAALAKGGEVIVSRGELIEIGDGFRIPEIMEQSGAVLREVGTTNRTHLRDYENAINENTRLLLRVHPSNFAITGFTEKPSLQELAQLSERSGLPLVEDLGSGSLVDLTESGFSEPTVKHSLDSGVSLILFSGDKLLGGPQAGVIAGKKDLVERVRRHPLFRPLRVDKLTIAALETTLNAYLRSAWEEIPAQRMIRMTAQELQVRVENFLEKLRQLVSSAEVTMDIADGFSLAGGGSTPSQSLPAKIIRVASARYPAAKLEQRLRRPANGPSVIARVEDGRVLLDLRTVFTEQEQRLADALVAALR
ncbi:MAG: L-seryl-tRNA(Sec) selenium transferase [Acidobacteriota bacterium]|nr:L-seryl-tRNA(Sec) selenium transferase [Acidobacteriota bacterium]